MILLSWHASWTLGSDRKSFRAPVSSSDSSAQNSSLSPWDSTLIVSLLTVDSRVRVGSLNSLSFSDNFAEPSTTRDTNSSSFLVIGTFFAFSLLGCVSDASNFSNSSFSAIRISSSQIPPANKACSRKIPQIFVHFEISRLPGDLGHLADSNSIPWNPTTSCHPIQIVQYYGVSSFARRAA